MSNIPYNSFHMNVKYWACKNSSHEDSSSVASSHKEPKLKESQLWCCKPQIWQLWSLQLLRPQLTSHQSAVTKLQATKSATAMQAAVKPLSKTEHTWNNTLQRQGPPRQQLPRQQLGSAKAYKFLAWKPVTMKPAATKREATKLVSQSQL